MRTFDPYFTLQKLEVFCLVAELQSVTRAADRLCVAQPVVTAHLRGLETKLGVSLVKRVGRNIGLTEAGERVYKWANDVLTRTREMERELSGLEDGAAGRAVIAASMTPGSYLLPALVSDFYAAHPEGLVSIESSNPQAALDAVRTGACDFAVLVMHPSENREGLTVYMLWEEALLLASAPHSKLTGAVAQPRELAALPFISAPRHIVRRELEEAQLREHGIDTRNVILEFGHPESQKHAVKRDLGLCFFLESAIRADVERGDLRVVQTPGLEMSVPLFLIHRRDKVLSPFQRALMEHIRASTSSSTRSTRASGSRG
ncbi:HTH-type transcriptional activator CmpR [Paraburkholderia hiiakae]|uniref:HTH-type transcriptional activator CmpR n=1 Tax=Paraburkholderia hiiakae TaxID=1081782 RepID=A0ABM8NV42_9BURK|nr:LysR family transcriptional regulator [Paraburkholderia hiiakae]CAD6544943.1 HTH-type transcriptional activator CmpR [Paraburkholderia hiiakae]